MNKILVMAGSVITVLFISASMAKAFDGLLDRLEQKVTSKVEDSIERMADGATDEVVDSVEESISGGDTETAQERAERLEYEAAQEKIRDYENRQASR